MAWLAALDSPDTGLVVDSAENSKTLTKKFELSANKIKYPEGWYVTGFRKEK